MENNLPTIKEKFEKITNQTYNIKGTKEAEIIDNLKSELYLFIGKLCDVAFIAGVTAEREFKNTGITEDTGLGF